MIIGFTDPLTGRKYSIDEVLHSKAGMIEMPVGVLNALVLKEKLDVRHSGLNITITSGLGCVRKWAISRCLDVHIDPLKCWARLRGTLLHEQLAYALEGVTGADGEPLFWTEERDEEKCVYEGELFGLRMSCKIDALKRDYSELWDYKFRSDYSARFMDKEGVAKDTDAAQVNMARLLIEQATGMDLSKMKMYVWVDAGGWHRTVAPRMSLAQIGRLKPGGGEFTVEEIFAQLGEFVKKADAALDAADDVKPLIAALPMAGAAMFNGKGCSHYCEFKDDCYALNGGM